MIGEILRTAPALELLAGKKVLELRPRVGWGKGQAVRLLRDRLARSLGGRPLSLYLGDDETDEEAFRALRGRAICVAVGRRRTRAAYRLLGPSAVERLLAWLAAVLD
jgi:trehalose-phosphatase